MKNTPYNQRVVLHPDGYPTTIGELKKQGLWDKMSARKKDFIVKCIDCGKPQRIHDYPGRWKTGDYRCSKCFDIWYAKQPPIELKLYDMMTNELVATRIYQR